MIINGQSISIKGLDKILEIKPSVHSGRMVVKIGYSNDEDHFAQFIEVETADLLIALEAAKDNVADIPSS